MPAIHLNGIDLHHEVQGDGPPLVIIHGGWTDHTVWSTVAGLLADEFRVVSYDRRGHSRTQRPPGPYRRRDHEDDLTALIEALDCAPAYLAGSSYGGLVALSLAARRPDLVRAVAVHEPVALSAATAGEAGRLARAAEATMATVVEEIAAGDIEGGTRRFVEEGVLGPGAWQRLPEAVRMIFKANAPGFLADTASPDWSVLDTDAVARFPGPILLTKGDSGPRWLPLLVDCLAERIPSVQTATVPGAGHSPHITHPAEYAALLRAALGTRSRDVPDGVAAGSIDLVLTGGADDSAGC
jgi:pimeloyl-ACP methyl ester carboxylesterase